MRASLAHRILRGIGAATIALVVVACSSDGEAARPEVAAVTAKLLETDDLTKAQATCAAGLLYESDLSDAGLRTMVESDGGPAAVGDDLSDADQRAFQAMSGEIATACLGTEGS